MNHFQLAAVLGEKSLIQPMHVLAKIAIRECLPNRRSRDMIAAEDKTLRIFLNIMQRVANFMILLP
jgi:hypothetical protein